jgi:CheY-like chemotaxis protein
MKIAPYKTTIMIVDDEPENLNVLGEMLRVVGWSVRAFPRGEMALDSARSEPPDLVLLDIRMPCMNGYEVCRRFKADECLRQIPIIFLSAFAEPSDKAEAFGVGGVDYVTKPFAEIEVLARVNTHLGLRRHQLQLEELVQQRVQELAEAHRRLRIWDDAKNQWLNVLSHEMRTPLNGVLGISELLFMDLPPESDQHALRLEFDNSCSRIRKLMDDALTLAQIDVAAEGFALSSIPMAQVLRGALSLLAGLDPASQVCACVDALEGVTVSGELNLLMRAFIDLLLSATHCVGTGEAITLETRVVAGRVKVSLVTRGKSLSADALETFFEVGGQRTLLKNGGDLGLGAALAARIIRLFKGYVSVRNGAEQGLVIEISLPLGDPQPAATAS